MTNKVNVGHSESDRYAASLVDRLLRFLADLGHDVEIVVTENPHPTSRGRVHLTAA